MTWPILDNFTEAGEAFLIDHVPDSGGTWAVSNSWGNQNTSFVRADAGDAYTMSSSIQVFNIIDAPPSADYEVECVINVVGPTNQNSDTGPAARIGTASLANYTLALTSGDANELTLQRWNPGKVTLTTHSIPGFTTGVWTIKLGVETVAGDVVLRGYVNGTEILVDGFPFTDADPAKILDAGLAGMMFRDDDPGAGANTMLTSQMTAAVTGAPPVVLPVLSNATLPVYTP